MVVITNYKSDEDDIAKRNAIILTGRAHPGDTYSSYFIEGIINFLISKKNPTAEKLRKLFVFKIIPMLNCDGVINGNTNSNFVGLDYNKEWQNPNILTAPEICAVREVIKTTQCTRPVHLFCDIHDSSVSKSLFMQGCNNNNSCANWPF